MVSSACVIPVQAFEAVFPSPSASCQDQVAIDAIKAAVIAYIIGSVDNVVDNSVVVTVVCREASAAGRRLRQSGVQFVVTATFSVDTVGATSAQTAADAIEEDTCATLPSLCASDSPVEIDTENVVTSTYNPESPAGSLEVTVTPGNPAVTTPITVTATYARPGVPDISGKEITLNPSSADVTCTPASSQATNGFGNAVFMCTSSAEVEVSFTVTTSDPLGGADLSATASTTVYAYPTLTLSSSAAEPAVGTPFTLTATYARPGGEVSGKEVSLAADPAGNVNCGALTATAGGDGVATFTCTATAVSLSFRV